MTKKNQSVLDENVVFEQLDGLLLSYGFHRAGRSRKYSRSTQGAKQIIEIYFLKPAYSDDRSIANIEVFLEVQIPEVNEKALALVNDPFLRGTAPEATIRQPIGLVSPKRALQRWSPKSKSELARVASRILSAIRDWAIPFLDDYRTKEDLVRGVEARDARLPIGPVFFTGVIAAYLLLGKKEQAAACLSEHFNSDSRLEYYNAISAHV